MPDADPDDVTDRAPTGSDGSMPLPDLLCADLDEVVEAARQGDVGAFNEVVRRTYAGTYNLARRLVTDLSLIHI